MINKELQDLLKQYPDDMPVHFSHSDEPDLADDEWFYYKFYETPEIKDVVLLEMLDEEECKPLTPYLELRD